MFASVASAVLFGVPSGATWPMISYLANASFGESASSSPPAPYWPQIGPPSARAPGSGQLPGVPALRLAWPMLVQMVALPIAMQTVACCSATSAPSTARRVQPGLAAVRHRAADHRRRRHRALADLRRGPRADRVESPAVATLWFLARRPLVGRRPGGAVAACSPTSSPAGQIHLDLWLRSFVVFVALQAAKYPIGMYMTDKRGLVFQVVPILVMVPLNLGLSWWLIGVVGAGGPVVGGRSVALCQVVPNLWYVRVTSACAEGGGCDRTPRAARRRQAGQAGLDVDVTRRDATSARRWPRRAGTRRAVPERQDQYRPDERRRTATHGSAMIERLSPRRTGRAALPTTLRASPRRLGAARGAARARPSGESDVRSPDAAVAAPRPARRPPRRIAGAAPHRPDLDENAARRMFLEHARTTRCTAGSSG